LSLSVFIRSSWSRKKRRHRRHICRLFGDILARVDTATGGLKPIRVYLDNGGVGLEATLQPGCDQMLALLRAQGYKEGVQFQWFHEATAEHNEQAWAARVWRPLTFLFGRA
jgi:hypothetical protein